MTAIRRASAADRAGALRSVVAAFAADPVLRYLFPDQRAYPAQAATFFGGLYDARLLHGCVWVADDLSAAAMWSPPERPPAARAREQAMMALMVERLGPEVAQRLEAYEDSIRALLPTEPFFYLGVLAVRPDRQGAGLGGRLIEAGLGAPERAGCAAVLETATQANVAFYTARGWEVVASTAHPVPIWLLRHD